MCVTPHDPPNRSPTQAPNLECHQPRLLVRPATRHAPFGRPHGEPTAHSQSRCKPWWKQPEGRATRGLSGLWPPRTAARRYPPRCGNPQRGSLKKVLSWARSHCQTPQPVKPHHDGGATRQPQRRIKHLITAFLSTPPRPAQPRAPRGEPDRPAARSCQRREHRVGVPTCRGCLDVPHQHLRPQKHCLRGGHGACGHCHAMGSGGR